MTAKPQKLNFVTYGNNPNYPNYIWTLDKGYGVEVRSEPHTNFNNMLCHAVNRLKTDIRDPDKIKVEADETTKAALFTIINNLYPEAPS